MKTTASLFQNTLQKTDQALKEIEEQLKLKNERRFALQILKTVLHTLRDRLTLQEIADLSAQLPTLMRGIFFEGWKPREMPIKMNKQEFLDRIRDGTPTEVYAQSEDVVATVLRILHLFISKGEMKDIKSTMPKSLSEIFPD